VIAGPEPSPARKHHRRRPVSTAPCSCRSRPAAACFDAIEEATLFPWPNPAGGNWFCLFAAAPSAQLPDRRVGVLRQRFLPAPGAAFSLQDSGRPEPAGRGGRRNGLAQLIGYGSCGPRTVRRLRRSFKERLGAFVGVWQGSSADNPLGPAQVPGYGTIDRLGFERAAGRLPTWGCNRPLISAVGSTTSRGLWAEVFTRRPSNRNTPGCARDQPCNGKPPPPPLQARQFDSQGHRGQPASSSRGFQAGVLIQACRDISGTHGFLEACPAAAKSARPLEGRPAPQAGN